MSNPTPAQEEFADFLAKNSSSTNHSSIHPEDRRHHRDTSSEDLSEEEAHRAKQVDAAMRMPTVPSLHQAAAPGGELKLPPASFDSGRSTGVKGVIADARSYEAARRNKWMTRVRTARRSIFGLDSHASAEASRSESNSETDEDGNTTSGEHDEESFLAQWRESRRRELESEAGKGIRNRRTSPSVRIYGRMDEVDALGYLDAIEKVRRDTVVVVYVYDPECEVSATVEAAIRPLVAQNPTVHFVKVHCDEIEFDPAAVPAVLGYRNQGDLFANLTGIFEMIPEESDFDTESLRKIMAEHHIL